MPEDLCGATVLQLDQLNAVNKRGCFNEKVSIEIEKGVLAATPPIGSSVTASFLSDSIHPVPPDYVIAVSEKFGIGIQLESHDSVARGDSAIEFFGSLEAIDELVTTPAKAARGSAEAAAAAASLAAPSLLDTSAKCTSLEYNLKGWRQPSTFSWSWSTLPWPGDPTMMDYQGPVHVAAEWITNGMTTCDNLPTPGVDGIPEWGPSHTYLGSTSSRSPNIDAPNGTCDWPDNHNTMGLYALGSTFNDPNAPLAVACTWRNGLGVPYDSDIAFDLFRNWNINMFGCVTPYPGNSEPVYDLYSVALHEWGHIYNLGHVSMSSGQIMRPQFSPCEQQFSLGRGDWFALLYWG